MRNHNDSFLCLFPNPQNIVMQLVGHHKGFIPPPDIVTPSYHVPAGRLFALVRGVADGQPRTYQAALYPDQFQVHYVVRSAVLNFPDQVVLQVLSEGPDSSELIVYSRSVYGRSDFGVNRKRVEAWLAVLQTKIPPSSER